MDEVNEDFLGVSTSTSTETQAVVPAFDTGKSEASSNSRGGKELQRMTDVCSSTSSSKVRRRCWDEAFSSGTESESITPEPNEGLQLDKMEGVDMCTSSNGGNGLDKEKTSHIVCEAHPGCFKTFASVRDYEEHYNFRHRHKCITCKKSLPSAHILELHVLEAHDTLFSLMAERKPMLACFLESCSVMFWKSEERKEHCLSEHKFPKSFKLWNLTTVPVGGTYVKKPGSKTKGSKDKPTTNKQNQSQKDNNKPISKKHTEKTQISCSSVSGEVSSTSDVPFAATCTLPTLNKDTMEIDNVEGMKNTTQKPAKSRASNSTSKGKGKSTPSHIMFGQAASRAFQPKHTFGLPRPVSDNRVSSDASKMDLDDIKAVLLATTDTLPCVASEHVTI